MQVHGACHCGQVKLTAVIDPAKVMICHCSDCQTLSGAPLRAIAQAPIESLKLTGQTKRYVKTAESGTRRAQVFCPECGTPLYACAEINPPTVTLRVGCLAERAQLKPALALWQRSAAPWLADLPAIPGVAAQLPPQ
jgi:hypothetical protein